MGVVFWYGWKFYGCKIVNGEIYNMNVMMVVYFILLLLLFVKVMNLSNGRFEIFWVNDWGFFVCG